ncbi:MAG: type II toxin-antitoxin system PemK/MazF family toxin [Thermoleophilaceae bacterium]
MLSRDAVLPALSRPLVVPLTTRIRDIPTEVRLDEGDGLPQPCVASLDNVQPLAASLLVEQVSELRAERMDEVCTALAVATGCD